jgi:chromosomal replication initiator protein
MYSPNLWQNIEGKFLKCIGQKLYNLWRQRMRPVFLHDERLTLAFPSAYFKNKFHAHYQHILTSCISKVTNRNIKTNLVVSPEIFYPEFKPIEKAEQSLLYPMTFENFFVWKGNRAAYEAARHIASLKPMFKTLLLYGESGLGKTHLLNSIFHLIKGKGIRLFSAKDFSKEYIQASRGNNVNLFRQRYRSAAMLLIDDIHLLQTQKESQAELVRIFMNFLHQGKCCILTSMTHPQQWPGVSHTLKNRFRCEMEVALRKPDLPTRLQFLRLHSAPHIPEECLSYIAQYANVNMGILLRCIRYLAAYPRPQLHVAEKLVEELQHTETHQITLEDIAHLVADYLGIKEADLYTDTKHRLITMARQICFHLAHKYTTYSLTHIGQHFGRNHSTVIFGLRKMSRTFSEPVQRILKDLEPRISMLPGSRESILPER